MDLKGKPFYLSADEERWVLDALASMDEREKTGQLFCVMGGDYPLDELRALVSDEGIGAVLYRPCPKAELAEKLAAIDAAARIPLLHAANLEEGGAGGISDGTYFANQLGVAAADDEACARRFAEVCAAEGLAAGINWTFSPVVDIDMNFRNPITDTRTFGSEPERVLKNAQLFLDAAQDSGLIACCKHFPGDGVDFRDQHLHPSYNSLPAEEWRETYGKIYKALIDRGLLSVMVGHICQPALSMEKNPALGFSDVLPASLSRELLTGVLRGELGFNGLITTDATIMGGFCQAMERRRAIPSAIAAGADIAKIVEERLGLPTELYEPLADELHGPASLPEGRLTLVVANLPTASNQTAVRINWSRKHALDDPRFINEEPAAMISVANPYHLQDAPRIRTYINAYTPIAPASSPWASRRAAAFPRASRPPRPRPARSGQGPAGQAAPPARAGAGPGQSRRPHAPLRTLSCPPRGPARQPRADAPPAGRARGHEPGRPCLPAGAAQRLGQRAFG